MKISGSPFSDPFKWGALTVVVTRYGCEGFPYPVSFHQRHKTCRSLTKRKSKSGRTKSSMLWSKLFTPTFFSCLLAFLPYQPVHGEGYPLHEQSFVVPLTDDNFEHETQASTGGTTGSWLVWFHATQDRTPIAGEVLAADFWTENHVVLASLDAKKNGSTSTRFGVSKLPMFIFIHKGKYYRLDKTDEGNVYNWEMIQNYVTDSFAKNTAFDIPPPRTTFDEFLEMLRLMYTEMVGPAFPYLVYFVSVSLSLTLLNYVYPKPPLPPQLQPDAPEEDEKLAPKEKETEKKKKLKKKKNN